jgi:protein-disulfide isomerase
MSRRSWIAGIALALLVVTVLWSSSFIVGAAQRINPTAQQRTVDALVEQRFQQTATMEAREVIEQTRQTAYRAGLTSTAAMNATVDAAVVRAVTATAEAAAIEDSLSSFFATITAEAEMINPALTATAEANVALTNLIDFDALPHSRRDDGAFVVGDPDAPVTLIVFNDFACPHCQAYFPTVQQFIHDYVVTGKANFELRVFPTAGGPLTYFAGQLLECSEKQKPGSYWQGYRLMFSYAFTGRYNRDVGQLYAKDLDLNYQRLLSCAETATQVGNDIAFGEEHDVMGTPAVLVRHNNGDARFITYGGRTYSAGGPPYEVLAYEVDDVHLTPTQIPLADIVYSGSAAG